jgi:hypothetical protein
MRNMPLPPVAVSLRAELKLRPPRKRETGASTATIRRYNDKGAPMKRGRYESISLALALPRHAAFVARQPSSALAIAKEMSPQRLVSASSWRRPAFVSR